MIKTILNLTLILTLSFSAFASQSSKIILATTTSVRDSGLMDHILPIFERESGYQVDMIAVGTGKALQMGRDGEADVLLVHAKPSELEFMKEGHGTTREEIFHNYFVLVGPRNEVEMASVEEALKLVKKDGLKFISRGDNSGTNKKELSLWKENNIDPAGRTYISSGSGMGATLKVADEMEAYTLSDIATFLNHQKNLNMEIKVGSDNSLLNQYSVMTINPDKNAYINEEGAKIFSKWISSDEVKDIVEDFGKAEFGMSLFVPERN